MVNSGPNRTWSLGSTEGTTYTGFEVQLIILTIEVSVYPVAVLGVAAEEAVDLSPSVVLFIAPASTAMVAREFARELAELVASIYAGSDNSSLLQLRFCTRFLLVAT